MGWYMRDSRSDVNQNSTMRRVKVQSQVKCPPTPSPMFQSQPDAMHHVRLTNWNMRFKCAWILARAQTTWLQYNMTGVYVCVPVLQCYSLASRKCPQWMTTKTRNWNSRMNYYTSCPMATATSAKFGHINTQKYSSVVQDCERKGRLQQEILTAWRRVLTEQWTLCRPITLHGCINNLFVLRYMYANRTIFLPH